ncbi:MAG: glycosyltransferase family 39 protein [Candidatus Goldbacteria bacterium]|nr:glycosyltransferase family 39 protein [Candidatus Goldiibacteriota bacterium]
MYCYKCNGKIEAGHIFCPHCGVKVKSEPIVITEVYKVKETAEKKPEEAKVHAEKPEFPAVKVLPSKRLLSPVFSAGVKEPEYKQPAITQADVNPFMKISDNIGAAFVPAAGDFKKMLGAIGPFYIMALALFIVFTGQAMIFGRNSVNPSVYLWYVIASVIFLAAEASYRYRRVISQVPEIPEKSTLTKEIIYVSIITAVAAFFRLYIINETPAGFAYDESTLSAAAVEVINKSTVYGYKMPAYVGGDIKYSTFFIYILSFVFKFFGAGIVQARVTMAIIGILSAVGVYFLSRRMFGIKAAFFIGLIFAVMRWHVNFSRITFYAVFGVFLGIAAVYFIYMVLTRGKKLDFALLGVTLGLVPYGYTPGRMLLLAVLFTGAFIAIRDISFYKQNRKKIILSLVLFIITFAPLGGYFLTHRQEFMSRTSQVSILDEKLVQTWFHGKFTREQAIKDTFKKTFQMFTRYGDQNPRHNIPGKPMLDIVTGGLAVLGLGFMIFRILNVFYFFVVTLFICTLIPGLLTIEAPQSHRVIYSIIPIIIFVGFVINRFFVYAAEQFAGKARTAAVVTVFIGCGMIAGINYKDYFEVQAKNNVCWSNFDTISRTAAEFVMSKGDDWYGIVDPAFAKKTFYFLAREKSKKSYGYYSPSLVPYANPEGKKIYYLLGLKHKNTAVYDLPRIYPKGRLITIYEKYNSAFVHMYAFEVDEQEAMANRDRKLSEGFYAKYFGNERWEGYPSLHRIDSVLSFDWHAPPLDGPFSAEWTAYLQSAGGAYEFGIDTNNYADLQIDGKTILTVDMKNSVLDGNPKINLSAGTHKIRVRYMENTGYSRMHLRWKKPGSSSFEIIDPMFLKPLK